MNILLVEDDLLNMRSVLMIAEEIGLTLSTAIDGVLALEIAEECGIDVAIIDLSLPRKNGIEVIKALSCPAIAWSASQSPMDIRRAFDSGAFFYVYKGSPFQFRQRTTILLSAFLCPDWQAALRQEYICLSP